MSNTVPNDWEAASLRELCKFSGGSAFKEKYQGRRRGEYPFIKVSDMTIDGNQRFITNANHWIDQATKIEAKIKLFPASSVVFAKVGAALLLNRRRILTRETAIDNNMMAAIPNSDDNNFLYYVLQEVDLREIVQGGAVPSVNQAQMEDIPTLIPPLPEQQKIAAILSSVDNVIEKTRAQIDKLKDLKTGMMQELLTKGIERTEFKDSPVGRIPKGWSVQTLGETATLQRGHDLTQANSVMGRYPVVSSSGVSAMHDEYTTQGPGVVVGRKGSIGRVHYIQSDFWAHDTSLYVTNFHGNDVLFIYQLLSWLDLQKYGTKSGSPSLNRNDLHPLKLAIPPVAEQIEIRKVLMHVYKRTSLLHRKLNHLTGLKKALMQDLLTGKVRANVDQKEPAVA